MPEPTFNSPKISGNETPQEKETRRLRELQEPRIYPNPGGRDYSETQPSVVETEEVRESLEVDQDERY